MDSPEAGTGGVETSNPTGQFAIIRFVGVAALFVIPFGKLKAKMVLSRASCSKTMSWPDARLP